MDSMDSKETFANINHAPFSYSAGTTFQPSVRCPTLTTFLSQLNLFQYHGSLINLGVEENNIEQLLGLDEAELKEVTDLISMKPFHSIVFKKGVRELRQKFYGKI